MKEILRPAADFLHPLFTDSIYSSSGVPITVGPEGSEGVRFTCGLQALTLDPAQPVAVYMKRS